MWCLIVVVSCPGQLQVSWVLAVSGPPVLVLCYPSAGSPPPGREATQRKPVAPAHPTRPVTQQWKHPLASGEDVKRVDLRAVNPSKGCGEVRESGRLVQLWPLGIGLADNVEIHQLDVKVSLPARLWHPPLVPFPLSPGRCKAQDQAPATRSRSCRFHQILQTAKG